MKAYHLRLPASLLVLACLPGCAWKSALNDADKKMAAKQYCAAITSYQKAEKEKPDIRKKVADYEKLGKAKRGCADIAYTTGQQQAEAGKLLDAISAYNEALKIDDSHEEAAESLKVVQARKADNEKKADELVASGQKHMAAGDWHKAHADLQEAITLNADHATARTKQAAVATKLGEAESLMAAAEAKIAGQEWGEASKLLNRLLAISPFYPKAAELLTQSALEIKKADEQYLKAEKLYLKSSYTEAELQLLPVLNTYPTHFKAKNLLANILYSRAGEHQKKGRPGSALKEYLRISKMFNKYKETPTQIEKLSHALSKSARYRVWLLPLINDSNDSSISSQYSKLLNSSLREQSQGRLQLLGDDDGKKALAAGGLNLQALSGAEKGYRGQKIKGVDAVVYCRIQSFELSSDENTEDFSKTNQSGVRRERNPAWDDQQELIRKARAEVNRNMSNPWASVAAQVAVTALINELSGIPQYNEIPIEKEWNYQIKTSTKTGELRVEFEVYDLNTGAPLFEDTITTTHKVEGKTTLKPNPKIGIPATNAKLPSSQEMKNAAIEKAINDANAKILTAFANYGISFLKQADQMVETDPHSAWDNYFRFLYSSPDESAHAADIERVKQLLGVTSLSR